MRSPSPIDAITLGPWQAWPNAGTEDVDPYSRARLARTGEIPLGSGEGLTLLAQTDDAGRALTARCDYRIVGQTPPARLWTLTLENAQGRVVTERDEVAALVDRIRAAGGGCGGRRDGGGRRRRGRRGPRVPSLGATGL